MFVATCLGGMAATTDRVDVMATLNALFATWRSPCEARATSYGGLGIFATRDIRAGERVLHERPLVLTVSRVAECSVCAFCLKRRSSSGPAEWLLRCERCERCHYCSESCAASHIHDKFECEALEAAAADTDADDVSDLVTQAIALLALRRRGESREVLPTVHMGFEAYRARLHGIRRNQRNGEHIKRAVVAALRAVGEDGRVPPKELFDVLSRHQCNVYGCLGPGGEDVALASFVGAFHLYNHSCLPNLVFDCQPQADDTKSNQADGTAGGWAGAADVQSGTMPMFALVALEAVQSGEELVHCYAGSADGPTARRAYLRDHHGFECVCARCTTDDPEEEAELTEQLDCARCVRAECGSGLGYPIDEHALSRRCVQCGHSWSTADL